MSTQYRVDGDGFVSLIRAGHLRLKQHVQQVNALNIFPVPDGDTGTNMELSLAAGVAQLASSPSWSLGAAVQALSSGLLMGARGNSGVILSQLWRGFLKVAQRDDALDASLFAMALQEGVQIAYRAVAKPVEGTMLTVAREAAVAGHKAVRPGMPLDAWFDVVVQAARRTLAETPEHLAILKQAGVVDSGGQGLVYIYEGMLQQLQGVDIEPQAVHAYSASAPLVEMKEFVSYAGAHIHRDGDYGYCTEVLLRVPEQAPQDQDIELSLRKQLASYGDSLLVVSAEDLVKVHVHTLHPGRVLEDALAYGP
ncbi:MAG: DAK2 domain-containing protein, partial [Alicyclobacillus sp.]|nr:DAK2 domain-containing protein [Alicyclobacillus sp.]